MGILLINSSKQLDSIITHLLHTVSPHWLDPFDFKQLPPKLSNSIVKLPRHEKQILLLALLKYMANNPQAYEHQLENTSNTSAKIISHMLEHDPKEYIYRQMIDTKEDDY